MNCILQCMSPIALPLQSLTEVSRSQIAALTDEQMAWTDHRSSSRDSLKHSCVLILKWAIAVAIEEVGPRVVLPLL